MTTYELWYADPLGNRISLIPNVSAFSYVTVAGDIGLAQFSTPIRDLVHEENVPDRRILIYRQAYSGAKRLEIVAFLDSFTYSTDADGLGQFTAGASDPNVLPARRIVAYASDDAKATYTGSFTSGQMWQAIRRNLGSQATDTDRDITGSNFDEGINTQLGGTIDKQAAYKNVLALLQDMQAFSKQAGTEVFFAIVPTSETDMQFQTYTGQPGSDRTATTGNTPVVFSLERGNLLNPSLTYDYSSEANYIYAGGKGQQSQRNVQEASNATSIGLSPYARKEKFVSAISGVLDNTDAEIAAKAKDALEKYRARVNLTATIISTPRTEYGLHWFFGDKVTVDYAGFQFDTVIRALRVQVDGDGRETIGARVELSNE